MIVAPRLPGWVLPLLHVENVKLDDGRDRLAVLLGYYCTYVMCVVGGDHVSTISSMVLACALLFINEARTERGRGRPEELLKGGDDAVAIRGVALGAQHLLMFVYGLDCECIFQTPAKTE